MSTSSGKGEYLLLVRGADWHKGLSPEQLQNVMSQFRDWLDGLTEQGKIKGAQPLEREGRVVSGRHGRIVADGPFAESKEAIGGYFLLQVKDLDEATAIAQSCPTLEYGSSIEVRPVAELCPLMESMAKAGEQVELAAAIA
jgi:hypothetical protein